MKRFYRVEEGKKIAGVCSGLADIFNMDANLVRILLVFVCVATGVAPTIVAYLAAWYLLPEEKTPINKKDAA
jgi:phage shock protein C